VVGDGGGRGCHRLAMHHGRGSGGGGGSGAWRQRGADRVHPDRGRHRERGASLPGPSPSPLRGYSRDPRKEISRRNLRGPVRVDHRPPKREHRQKDLAQCRSQGFWSPGLNQASAPAPVSEPRLAGALLLGALGVGAAIRLWLSVNDDGIYWPDEIYQSLEPAHRLVFGYGLVAWEFVQGARSWLLAGALAAGLTRRP